MGTVSSDGGTQPLRMWARLHSLPADASCGLKLSRSQGSREPRSGVPGGQPHGVQSRVDWEVQVG